MRKYKQASSHENSISCSSTPYTDCPNTQRQRITSESSCSFINCKFNSISNTGHTKENGGAISYAVANGNLFVSNCYFYDCITQKTDCGAIDARNADYVTVELSTFDRCIAHTQSGESGGGGINLYKIQQHPYIHLCSFFACSSDDDGGGMSISNTAPTNIFLCDECKFVNGETVYSKGHNNYAGGLILWDNNKPLRCSNTLFTSNKATYGGAYGTNCNANSPDYPLRFCFFHNNQGSCGNDACFRDPVHSFRTEYFLHCFSTTATNRVQNRTNSADFSTWLPQGSIFFVNLTSD